MTTKTVSLSFFCIALIASVFLFVHFVKSATTNIVITEIAAYEASGHEWIEIHNKETEPIDLSAWTFWEAGVNHGLTLVQGEDSIIEPNEYAIIAQNDIYFLQDYPNVTTTVFDSSWGSLKESGEEIGIKDADGLIIEQFTYIAAPNFSLERKDPLSFDYSAENWIEHPSENSAGAQNYWHAGNSEPTVNTPPTAIIQAPTSTLTDTPILLNATSSTDSDGLIMLYHWQFGDEQEADGASVTHMYTATGTFSIVLTVADNDAATSTASTTILAIAPEPEEIPEEPENIYIVINEFLPYPETEQKEWIEIYNTTNTPAALAGVTIEDGTGNIIASPSTTLPGQGFLTIILPSPKLNNSGDILIVRNKEGEILDQVTYGDWEDGNITDNAPTPKQSHSLARVTDGYDSDMDHLDFAETDTPTPSEANIIELLTENEKTTDTPEETNSPPPSATVYHVGDIVINELVSDPADGFVEFVELYNTTAQLVSLDGWWVEEGSGSKTILSQTIGGHGFVVVEKPKGNLNNNGDIVRLFAPTGTLIDRVAYGDWDDGNTTDNAPKAADPTSIARMYDGKDTENDVADFALTTTITRGGSNSISAPITQIVETEQETSKKQDTTHYPEHIVITEIFPNPEGSDGEEEFIEIKNIGNEQIDLADWKIGDGSNRRYTISNLVISANEYLAFKRKTTGIALNNTGGDSVSIYAPNGNTIDTMMYDVTAPEGESYARMIDDQWKWTALPTPGTQNIIEEIIPATKKSQTDMTNTQEIPQNHYADIDTRIIFLSEFIPNPVGSDDAEFIELFNAGDLAIDLSGLQLDDEDGRSRPYTLPEGTIAPAHAYLVFPREQTKLALNNTGDTVRLLHPDGTILESVTYATLPEGTSYAKNEDDEWFPTGTPTPGTRNDFSIPKAVAGIKIQQADKVAKEIPIAEIQHADAGDYVTTVGTVVVEPSVLGSQYFYIVDASDSDVLPGIQIYMHSKDFPDLAVGDHITVTGETSEAQGKTRIKVTDKMNIQSIDHTGEPIPIYTEIANIDGSLEGSFIEINGEITELKGSYMYVDDGTEEIKIYFKNSTGISKETLALGDLVAVKGILSHSTTENQLLPRKQTDITKTGVTEEVVAAVKEKEEKENKNVAEKYLAATAGGLFATLLVLILKSKLSSATSFFARFRNKKKEE